MRFWLFLFPTILAAVPVIACDAPAFNPTIDEIIAYSNRTFNPEAADYVISRLPFSSPNGLDESKFNPSQNRIFGSARNALFGENVWYRGLTQKGKASLAFAEAVQYLRYIRIVFELIGDSNGRADVEGDRESVLPEVAEECISKWSAVSEIRQKNERRFELAEARTKIFAKLAGIGFKLRSLRQQDIINDPEERSFADHLYRFWICRDLAIVSLHPTIESDPFTKGEAVNVLAGENGPCSPADLAR